MDDTPMEDTPSPPASSPEPPPPSAPPSAAPPPPMPVEQTPQSAPAPPAVDASASGKPKTGLGVAALVIGVASLVAAISFLLFPLGLIGGIVGLILGIVAVSRSKPRVPNRGQAIAGIVCSAIALVIAVDLTIQVGTWIGRNTSVFTRFDSCIAQSNGRADIADCIATFANDVRP
jgi:hypothetical protein